MINESADLVILEPKKQDPRKKEQGRFALIRATASADSIELEPIGGTYFGDNSRGPEGRQNGVDKEREKRPWSKDMNTLSPHTWQKKHTEGNQDVTTPMMQNIRDDYGGEEKKSTPDDDAPSGATSPNSLSRMAADSIHAVDYDQAVRALEPKKTVSHDDERSRGTDDNIPSVLPPEFANSLSKGVIQDAAEETASDVVFGEPMTYGAAGGNDISFDAPAVSDRAKAIEDWTDGLGDKPQEQERNRHFFPDSGRGSKDIFKELPNAFGFEENPENKKAEEELPKGAKGASAVLRFWSSTSKDEVDDAQSWKDLDPDIDNYSDTIVDDDSPEKIIQTSRVMSTMKFSEHDAKMSSGGFRRTLSEDYDDPGAAQPDQKGSYEAPSAQQEPDPFSLDAVAALSQATSPKSKKPSNAFDPFGDSFFGDAIDFSNLDPDGLFAPSSASDVSSKKSLPTLAGSKKDTRPINTPGSANRKMPVPPPRAATPSRTDAGLPKVLGTPPRSPTRRPINVNQIQEELDDLAPSRDSASYENNNNINKDNKILRPPSGDEMDESLYTKGVDYPPEENEYSLKQGNNDNDNSRNLNDSIWSFDQGLDSYDHQDPSSLDRYDADVETIDMTTLDDSHPCEI